MARIRLFPLVAPRPLVKGNDESGNKIVTYRDKKYTIHVECKILSPTSKTYHVFHKSERLHSVLKVFAFIASDGT